jgi:hypothetical protein
MDVDMDVDAAAPAQGSSVLSKKKFKKVLLSSSTQGQHTTAHRHPRRSTRPIIAKGSKSARIQKEEAQKAAQKAVLLSKVDAERIKRLQKLLSRQEAAGNTEAVAETLEKIKAIERGVAEPLLSGV